MSKTENPAPRDPLRWVPIRALAPHHRPRIAAHLKALDERDRYLRFGYAASDEQIDGYVEALDFDRDEVFGIFNRRLQTVAVAHLALEGVGDRAEFGVSVARYARGRGWGARLFERAVLHARNRGVTALVIHALSENAAMLKIARQAGAVLEVAGPEATALLKLPAETVASHVAQMVEHQAAELDYGLKVQARRLRGLLGPPEARDAGAAPLTQARGRPPAPPV